MVTNNAVIYAEFTINTSHIDFIDVQPLPFHKTILQIHHPHHNLSVGNEIIIRNAASINGIASDSINGRHIITRVVNSDHYDVTIPIYKMVSSDFYPSIVTIKYPVPFQLYFDRIDTLGNLLNFNDVGKPYAISRFVLSVSNTDPYIGNHISIPIKALDIHPLRYFYLCCEEISVITNVHGIANVLAIIKWNDDTKEYVYNSYAPMVAENNLPRNISVLHFRIVDANGRLVEFHGQEHSFVLELTEQISKILTDK